METPITRNTPRKASDICVYEVKSNVTTFNCHFSVITCTFETIGIVNIKTRIVTQIV